MTIPLTLNDTLQDIVSEAGCMDSIEQKSILAYIRSLRIIKSGKNPVHTRKNAGVPSIQQIDKWKHEAREAARK